MKTLLLTPKLPQEYILKDGCYYNSKGKITEWSITQLEFYSLSLIHILTLPTKRIV